VQPVTSAGWKAGATLDRRCKDRIYPKKPLADRIRMTIKNMAVRDL
jgi:hypothetical protein